MNYKLPWIIFVTNLLLFGEAQAREWSDESGNYTIEADLFAFDEEHVILQREDKQFASFDIEALSENDREYLASKAAEEINNKNLKTKQTWTTTSGLQIVGRPVDYVHGKVLVQRRRGRMFVNNKVFTNLPELYQKLFPKLIEHFEGIEIPDDRAMQNWLRSLGGDARSFHVEGVWLEVENGDEYALPFFVFRAEDKKILKRGWSSWLSDQEEEERQREHALRLEAAAAAHQQNQKLDRQIALANLNLQAIRAGLTSAWEVTLQPLPGNPHPPKWVVVTGRNSNQAIANALQQHPGFLAGPVRRVSRRR